MIKLLASFILIFISLNLFSQEINKNSYGISVGAGEAGIYTNGDIMGGPGYDACSSFEAGFNFYHPLYHKVFFESGLYWHYNKIKVTPNFYPGMDMTPRYYNCDLLYVPLNLKVMLSKHFFIHGGLLLNVDISNSSPISNQTGLGSDFGFGVELPVFKHYSISINPYVNIHGLYKIDRHDDFSESLISDGIRITFKR
jgi:hypothetical protein